MRDFMPEISGILLIKIKATGHHQVGMRRDGIIWRIMKCPKVQLHIIGIIAGVLFYAMMPTRSSELPYITGTAHALIERIQVPEIYRIYNIPYSAISEIG